MSKITIEGVIGWDVYSSEIARELATMRGKDIVVEMATPGGLVSEGIAIYNRLKNHDGAVTIRMIGNVSSMGTYIAMVGDTIEAEQNVVFMIHNPRNFAAGDYQIMRKNANNLESLASLLARVYAERTGKAMDEIRGAMDDETYYFGEEMVEAGFVDKIIGDDTNAMDRSEAIAIAETEINACIVTMKESDKAASDIEQAAAMLDESNKNRGDRRFEKPANAENNQEVIKMDLKTAMAENPAIQAEIDALAQAKYDAGFSDGKGESEGRINATSNFLGDADYPNIVKALALKVLKGDEPAATLTTVVTILDAQKEEANNAAAQKEQDDDTNGQANHNLGNDDGVIASEEDYQAEIAKAQGGNA
jgi:ATP-dependent protease ClpP protease subunit